MRQSVKNYFWHLWVFILVEILFVLVIFRHFPTPSLLTLVGVLHLIYRWMVLVAWRLRETYAHLVRQKFLCTYVPIVYHVLMHLYVGWATIDHMTDHLHEHDHEMEWIIIGTVIAWVLIALGEYWLHRTMHCTTHHTKAHAHCHDGECEEKHS